jgi:ABC-type multidrug transport system fused ATPase/permease subunit
MFAAMLHPMLQVGLVSQEPTLFATSIYENIAQGRPGERSLFELKS